MTYTLAIIIAPTVLKQSPEQSTRLPANDKFTVTSTSVTDGKPWTLAAFREFPRNDHVRFTLAGGATLGGRNTWWAYAPHVRITGTEDGNNPIADQSPPSADGPRITVPGISRPVALNQPIYQGSNFSWAEATKGGDRIPRNARITENIVTTAKRLDYLRNKVNQPFIVTSWYRDPITNRRVGGASQSRHLGGDGVDFYVPGWSSERLFNFLKHLHTNEGGLAPGRGFVHIDRRGYAARWYYPGGPRVALW